MSTALPRVSLYKQHKQEFETLQMESQGWGSVTALAVKCV